MDRIDIINNKGDWIDNDKDVVIDNVRKVGNYRYIDNTVDNTTNLINIRSYKDFRIRIKVLRHLVKVNYIIHVLDNDIRMYNERQANVENDINIDKGNFVEVDLAIVDGTVMDVIVTIYIDWPDNNDFRHWTKVNDDNEDRINYFNKEVIIIDWLVLDYYCKGKIYNVGINND